MDHETQQIVTVQKKLKGLVEHEGWPVARQRFVERVLELQNAFSIESETPEKMLRDLEARKLASSLLYDFLRDIEGTATQADEVGNDLDKGHIVRL